MFIIKNRVYISLKSGKEIILKDFKYITLPNKEIIETFEEFYLYDNLLTLVAENDIVSLSSRDIEYINFYYQEN